MSDSAFKVAPFASYTTKQLKQFIADGSTKSNVMQAEIERRVKVAEGDRSVMTASERLRSL